MVPVVAALMPHRLLVHLVLIPLVRLMLLLVNVIVHHPILRPMPVVVLVVLLLVLLVRVQKKLVSPVYLDFLDPLVVSVPFRVAVQTVRLVVHPLLPVRVLLV